MYRLCHKYLVKGLDLIYLLIESLDCLQEKLNSGYLLVAYS